MVFDFWSIGCKGCLVELDSLNKIAQHFSSDTVYFVSFLADSGDHVMRFLSKKNINTRLVIDSYSIHKLFKINCYPTHLIINKNGQIIYNECGIIEDDKFKIKIGKIINKKNDGSN